MLTNEHIANEAFIRRAARLNMPFMLKGSYVSRQYFPADVPRYPADLDWVYLEPITDAEAITAQLDAWMIAVTEMELDDGVRFRSFTENRFWRMIEYAMADDFPTVNTDVLCWIGEEELELNVDVTFNLGVDQPPIPLHYQPEIGPAFEIPLTVPISLQISWKIHQTLVNPRLKDIFDLMYLVKHPSFDDTAREQMLQALVNECSVDEVDLNKLALFLGNEIAALFPPENYRNADRNWEQWRHGLYPPGYEFRQNIPLGAHLTDLSRLPEELPAFLQEVSDSLAASGLTPALLEPLPAPTRSKRPGARRKVQPSFQMPISSLQEVIIDPYPGDLPGISKPGPEPEKRPGLLARIRNWFS